MPCVRYYKDNILIHKFNKSAQKTQYERFILIQRGISQKHPSSSLQNSFYSHFNTVDYIYGTKEDLTTSRQYMGVLVIRLRQVPRLTYGSNFLLVLITRQAFDVTSARAQKTTKLGASDFREGRGTRCGAQATSQLVKLLGDGRVRYN